MYLRAATAGLVILCLSGCPEGAPPPAPRPAASSELPPSATGTGPATGAPAAGESDPWPGDYRGQDLGLSVQANGTAYAGTVSLAGRDYPLTATATGATLTGSFRGDEEFTFTLTQEGEALSFETGGTRHVVRRIRLQHPPAPSKE